MSFIATIQKSKSPIHSNAIPGIANRHYSPSLAGPLHPDGISILDKRESAEIGEPRLHQVLDSFLRERTVPIY